jgi:hypothetical protein
VADVLTPMTHHLILEEGIRVTGRECGCCGDEKVYAVTFEPNKDTEFTLYLCARCDVHMDRRDLS